jgi:CheY-like chemotaxis protein
MDDSFSDEQIVRCSEEEDMEVIIADDSSFVRNILMRALKEAFPDISITACANGREALEAYEKHPVNWIITDLLMPEMTGQEMIEALHAKGAYPKIIVSSADIQQATHDILESMEIAAYVNKPLTGEKLGTIIAMLKGA